MIAPEFQSTAHGISKYWNTWNRYYNEEGSAPQSFGEQSQSGFKKAWECSIERSNISPRVTDFCCTKHRHDPLLCIAYISAPELLKPVSSIWLHPTLGCSWCRRSQIHRLCECLEPLSLRRDVGVLCVFYRLYTGECLKKLFEMVPLFTFRPPAKGVETIRIFLMPDILKPSGHYVTSFLELARC